MLTALVIREKDIYIEKVGIKSNIAKSKVKVGIGEERCNHPEGFNLVAMPGGFFLFCTVF